ncbi:MAG: homoprotocatechuate degradation operon regulator HpaR [Pseudomonadota bacterium]
MRDFDDALPIAMLRAREALMVRFRPMLADHGLTEQQWRVIRAIHHDEAQDATGLADVCCILLPSLSRMLKSLEADGILERQKQSSDGRRQQIVLTQKGHDIFRAVAPHSEAIYADIEAQFGADAMGKLLAALKDLQRALGDR